MNGHNKLERSITLGREWLQGTNTLTYWAHGKLRSVIGYGRSNQPTSLTFCNGN